VIELDKRLKIIDSLIFDYSEKRLLVDNQEKKSYDKLIVILNNQKLKIQRFKSEINQITWLLLKLIGFLYKQ